MDGSLTQCGAHSVDRIDGRALLLAGRSVMLLFAMMRVGLLASAHTVALRASVRISTTCFGMWGIRIPFMSAKVAAALMLKFNASG